MFPEETLELLEFPIILGQLAGFTHIAAARERALSLRPNNHPDALKTQHENLASARKIYDALGAPPIDSMEGLDNLWHSLRIGEILSLEQLRAVISFLHHCRLLNRYAQRAQDISAAVAGWGLSIQPLTEVHDEILRCIRGSIIDDHASPDLRSIRQKKDKFASSIREKLASILRTHPAWFQESFHSMRGERYVLPVKREYRAQLKGTVLDASSSGATVFIEPDSVRALHDELHMLSIAENNEVLRILATLTDMVAGYTQTLSINREAMVDIDFIFACARLSATMRGIAPQATPRRELLLKNARHPLLGMGVVPLSIELGRVKGLVITGPNTGGKTVSLKTVGLLSLMALAGLQVPADEAVIPTFSGIYCDIGDGQSLSQNLSTFSSHIKRIVRILDAADGRSLVLLDELGSGTDPLEGMGLAVAVLEEFKRRACLVVATSHYPEIKRFASETPGYMNARMTFDRATLSPLYRLEMGEAGDSCALYIAQRLGVPEALLERAWFAAYPDGDHQRMRESFRETSPSVAVEVPSEIEADMPVAASHVVKKVPDGAGFRLGDAVTVTSMKQNGIVSRERNAKGEIGVRVQGKNYTINEKRLRLFISAAELYPGEEYDLGIVLSTWQERKAKRDVERGKIGAVSVVEEAKE